MYLTRLTINRSRAAMLWVSNPYRVHRRLITPAVKRPRASFSGLKMMILRTRYWYRLVLNRIGTWLFNDSKLLSIKPELKKFNSFVIKESLFHFTY